MTYQIRHLTPDGMRVIDLTGTLSVNIIDQLILELLAITTASGIHRLLIDIRNLSGRLGYVDTFLVEEQYPEIGKIYRVAVVDNAENMPARAFHAKLAQRRGCALAFIEEIEKAEAWLWEES